MLGWVRNLIGFYEARDLVGFDSFRNVAAWLERGLAPAGGAARPGYPQAAGLTALDTIPGLFGDGGYQPSRRHCFSSVHPPSLRSREGGSPVLGPRLRGDAMLSLLER